MSKNSSPRRRLIYASHEPELRKGNPASLRRARPLRSGFDHARDPYISKQLKAMEKTEAQRREESSSGSQMVKFHRPFPELRPKYEDGPLRQAFNQAWLREQRTARMQELQAQHVSAEQNNKQSLEQHPAQNWEPEQ